MISHAQWMEKAEIVMGQMRETVKQESAGVTVQLATITCTCGRSSAVVEMYQGLYCKIWFCDPCSENHFGKTVEQYLAEHPFADQSERG